VIIELILIALAAGLGGSGAIRVATAKERHSRAVEQYNRVLKQIEFAKARLESELEKLGTCADVAFGKMRQANQILEPLKRHRKSLIPAKCEVNELVVLRQSTDLITSYSAAKAAAAGTIVGTALAAGSWTAVSMLGTASTGVAIGGLHGAAATNAALAWLGGGSLAAGGGGMIAGKLVLVNVVFLPIAAVAGIAAHLSATDIDAKAREIEETSIKNTKVVDTLKNRGHSIATLADEMTQETNVLGLAVARAEKRLFRFGVFSRIYKYFRFVIMGYYYSRDDMGEVEALGRALDKFTVRFRVDKREATSSRLALAAAAAPGRYLSD
jgi:hypothetical protein